MVKFYCYDGDIKKLIPAGWKFQKLYAGNYKSYHKSDIYLFVVSKMAIEIQNVDARHQVTLIDFIIEHRDEPESFWHTTRDNSFFKDSLFANWLLFEGKVISEREYFDMKIKWHNEYEKDNSIPYMSETYRIEYDLVKTILELDELGSVVIKDVN
jgi:hypothetical protein